MNNLKYFPFERNRYFYGKLLSVDDFEAEQRYMNDKRRLVNRFLHGTGVVCGLQVVEVDDMTISVEMGMALDFSGREIVVPQPVTKKLSSIEGFSEYAELEEEQGILYLGISYHETKIEPVHNIVRTDSMQEEEFNKYAEGYRLFVTGEEPEREGSWITELYEQTKTVYQGNGIRIRQTVPRYIQSGEESEFTVMVEKSGQKKLISFSYQIRLSGMEAEGNSLLEVSFDEHSFTPSDRYVFTKRVRARAVEDVRGCMEPVPDSFVLTVGQETKKDRIGGSFQVNISGGDPRRTMVQEYYHTAMEDVLRGNYKQPVYLARLEVIQAGDTYVIEKVENVPSQQYVWNNMLTAAMETMRMRLPAEGRGQFVLPRGQEEACEIDKKESAQIRTGDVWIRLGLGGVVGQCYYSDEIVHGLGPGEIFISLGLSQGERGYGMGLFGNPEIFEDIKCPRLELAAKADMGRGCFVIGLKCLEQVPAGRLRISWVAVRSGQTAKRAENEDLKLTIRPDIMSLKVGERQYFEAFLGDRIHRHVQWGIKEAGGGNIDANGCYLAPGQPGVYEILAQSTENRNLTAQAFVIVRDTYTNQGSDERQL